MAKSQTAHLQNIEILRSVSIVGVVLYHSFCPWLLDWNWIESPARPILSYLFNGVMIGRMPLFFSVSGYLFAYLFVEAGKYQNFFSFVKNKLRRLLLPCLLFSILLSLLGGG